MNQEELIIKLSINPTRELILDLMSIKQASIVWRELQRIGALKNVLPCLDKCWDRNGGPYHFESIFDHCMMAGDHISTKYPLHKLAGYLHDVGKPICERKNPRSGDIWFEGHDREGAKAIIRDLTNLKFPEEEIKFVSSLSKNHMRINHERLSPKGIRKTLRILKEDGLTHKDLIRVAISDKMGGHKSQKYYNILDVYSLLKQFRIIMKEKPVSKFSDLLINGNDVMEITGLKPGKEVGEILNWLLNVVIEDPEFNDKDKLIQLTKERMGV